MCLDAPHCGFRVEALFIPWESRNCVQTTAVTALRSDCRCLWRRSSDPRARASPAPTNIRGVRQRLDFYVGRMLESCVQGLNTTVDNGPTILINDGPPHGGVFSGSRKLAPTNGKLLLAQPAAVAIAVRSIGVAPADGSRQSELASHQSAAHRNATAYSRTLTRGRRVDPSGIGGVETLHWE